MKNKITTIFFLSFLACLAFGQMALNSKKAQAQYVGGRQGVNKTYVDSMVASYVVGISDGCSTLTAAVATIGATSATLVVPTAITQSADLTIPANVTLRINKGAVITVSSTKTLTINGTIEAGDWQIFSGAGSEILGAVGTVSAAWFGLTEDGVTDNSPAFEKCIAAVQATGGTIVIPYSGGSAYALATDITFPSSIHVKFQKGAKLKPMTVNGVGTATNTDSVATGTLTVGAASTTFSRSSAATGIYEGVSYLIANPGSGNERKLITDINPESTLGGQIASAFSGALSGASYSVSSATVNTSEAHGLKTNDVVVIDSVEYYVLECPTTTSFTLHKHPAATFSAVSYTRGVRVVINNCEMVRYQVVDTSGGGVVQFPRGADQVVYPEMWGAVGDGATGNGTINATAINRALRSGLWITNPYAARIKVVLAAGVYCLNDSIWLSPGQWLDGAGKSYDYYGGTKLFVNNSVNKSVIMDCATSLTGRASRVSNLTIQQGTQTQPVHGYVCQFLTGSELENVAFYGPNGTDHDYAVKCRVQVRGIGIDVREAGSGICLSTDSLFVGPGEITFRRVCGVNTGGAGDCFFGSGYKIHAESYETGKTPKGILIGEGSAPTINGVIVDNIGSGGAAGHGLYVSNNSNDSFCSPRLANILIRACKTNGVTFEASVKTANMHVTNMVIDAGGVSTGYGMEIGNGAYMNGGLFDGVLITGFGTNDIRIAEYISLSANYAYTAFKNFVLRPATGVEFQGDLQIQTVSGSMARENLIGLDSSGRTVLADAYEGGTRIPAVGIVWVAQTAGANRHCMIATQGILINNGWSALTMGGEAGLIWTSATAGAWTQTKPTTTNYMQQAFGYARAAKEIAFCFPAAYAVAP